MANIKELQSELKEINQELTILRDNLIYMLCHMNLEHINLINFHYAINKLLIRQSEIKDLIYLERHK